MALAFMVNHRIRWLPMSLIQCRLSSGQRVPLLLQAGNAAPKVLSTPMSPPMTANMTPPTRVLKSLR